MPALTDLVRTWTFGDVAAHAAALARRLIEAGGDRPVVLLADRGIESVVAVYGIWWAGRPVAVLDARDPVDRLVELAVRIDADLVVDATGSGRSSLGSFDVWGMSEPEYEAERWPEVVARPGDDVCLLQFTSGSTGRPKCVAKTFANMVRDLELFSAMRGYLAKQSSAIFMPIQFGGGFTLTCLGLATGRFTALADIASTRADSLCRQLAEIGIERLHLTSSMLRSLISALPPGRSIASLREVWLVGEPVHSRDVTNMWDRFGHDVVLGSAYGATERLGALCEIMVAPGDDLDDGPLPLGEPTGADVYRLDTDGRDDGSGEIIYRGELSAGYLDDPELNSERFGVDPDGVRTWRSGDLAVVGAGGRLVHRGRVDDMVKIGGRLVEPAETEAVLRTVNGILDVSVLGRRLPSGNSQLIAHVVVGPDADPDSVRTELRRRLPPHLVPGVLVRHEQLPMTDRGKVDRQALGRAPIRPWVRDSVPDRHDPRAFSVCALAGALLAVESVDPDDQLWDLGLDSLGAIELIAALSDSTGVSLDPSVLVGVSTCRELADAVASARRPRTGHVVEINRSGRATPWFCVAGGGGTALGFSTIAVEAGPDQPVVVYEQFGLHQRGRRDRTIAAAAERNLEDLRARRPSGPYVLLGHSWGGLVAHQMAARLIDSGEAVCLIVLDTSREYSHAPFSLLGAPTSIASRVGPWPVWATKWLVWQLTRSSRVLVRRVLPGTVARPGAPQRYGSFARTATRAARRHRVRPLEVSGALICPVESPVLRQWDDHPNLLRIEVGGDHFSMTRYPHVSAVLDGIKRVTPDPIGVDTTDGRA